MPFDPALNTSATGGYLLPTTPHPSGDLAFQRVINNLVAGITGLSQGSVRPRWQPVPAPIPPIETDWAAIGVIEFDGEDGGAYQKHFDDYSTQKEVEVLTVLASFYGPNAEKNARTFKSGMFLAQNFEEVVASSGLLLNDAGPVRTLPELVNDRWYKRADVEFVLQRDIDRDYNILSIAEVPGHIQGDAQGVPRTTDFNVTEGM